MKIDESTKIVNRPESKINSRNLRIKEIREEFNKLKDRFSKPKIKEIRRNLFKPKFKKTEKNLLELEKNLSKLKKYYDYDDTEIII